MRKRGRVMGITEGNGSMDGGEEGVRGVTRWNIRPWTGFMMGTCFF